MHTGERIRTALQMGQEVKPPSRLPGPVFCCVYYFPGQAITKTPAPFSATPRRFLSGNAEGRGHALILGQSRRFPRAHACIEIFKYIKLRYI
jgi:hypothetical protein